MVNIVINKYKINNIEKTNFNKFNFMQHVCFSKDSKNIYLLKKLNK